MPTTQRIKTFAYGVGSYSNVVHASYIPTQGASANADYFQSIASIPPFVGGILPGWAKEGKNTTGTQIYGIIRAVQLTTLTAVTGGGAGLFATANLWIYRSGAALATAAATTTFSTGINTVALTPFSLTVDTTASHAFTYVRFGDLLVFEWLQSATTGLALPVSSLSVDLI